MFRAGRYALPLDQMFISSERGDGVCLGSGTTASAEG